MAHKRVIFIALLAIWLMLASISCATAQTPPQVAPTTSQIPLGLRLLTDAEKAKAIQIALNTPEARELEKYSLSKTDFSWHAIVWEESVIKNQREMNYDVLTPSQILPSEIIYPHLKLHLGEIEPGYPEGRFLVDVTVDLVNEKALGLVVTHPLKQLPVR